MEVLIIQYPRGNTAMVWCDSGTALVSTNHAGLRAGLQRGVTDWEGGLLYPSDGLAFLSALHDYLFLNGYPVRWMKGVVKLSIRKVHRE